MKRAMAVAAVAAAAVLMAGCPRSGAATRPAEQRTSAQYYPLAVGNRWTYGTGAQGSGPELTVEVKEEARGYFRDNQGGELSVDAFGVRDHKRYLLRDPVEVGTAWTNVVSVSSIERYKIVEAGSRCEVPAGKFEDCVVVEATNKIDPTRTLVNEMTFARGVGIVKLETTLLEGQKRTPQTALWLKQFTLAGGGR